MVSAIDITSESVSNGRLVNYYIDHDMQVFWFQKLKNLLLI